MFLCEIMYFFPCTSFRFIQTVVRAKKNILVIRSQNFLIMSNHCFLLPLLEINFNLLLNIFGYIPEPNPILANMGVFNNSARHAEIVECIPEKLPCSSALYRTLP